MFRPGFIAGVTNSVFELHPEWWDLLCSIDTGVITISPQIAQAIPAVPNSNVSVQLSLTPVELQKPDSGDVMFIDDILNAVLDRAGEATIRLKCRDYVFRFARMAERYEEIAYGVHQPGTNTERKYILPGHGWVWSEEQQKRRDLASNASRFEAFRQTSTFREYMNAKRHRENFEKALPFDLWYQMDRLRVLRNMSDDDSAATFVAFSDYLVSSQSLTEVGIGLMGVLVLMRSSCSVYAPSIVVDSDGSLWVSCTLDDMLEEQQRIYWTGYGSMLPAPTSFKV